MLITFLSNICDQIKQVARSFSECSLNCLNIPTPEEDVVLISEIQDSPSSDLEGIRHEEYIGNSEPVSCCYCGESSHDRKLCPARHVKCGFCSKPGHFRSVCRKLARLSTPQPVLSAAVLNQVGRHPLTRTIIPVLVNGTELSALIDTGSTNTYMDSKLAKHLRLPTTPHSFSINLAASNSVVKSEARVQISEFSIQGQLHNSIQVATLDGLCSDMIIGHDLLSMHRNLVVDFGGPLNDFVISNQPTNPVCSVAVADVEPPPLFTFLSDDCRPIACKSRRYSEEDMLFIRGEIAKLLDAKIIEPCRSPWRAQVLVTKDDRQKKRMVIDYSRTINKFSHLDAYPLPRIDDMSFDVSRCKIYSSFDLKSAYHQIPILPNEKKFTAFEADGNLFQFNRIPFGVTNGVSAFQRAMSDLIKKNKLSYTWAYLDNVTVGGLTQEEHDTNVARFMKLVTQHNLTLNHTKTISSVDELKMLGYCISHLKVRPDPDRMQPLLQLPIPTDSKSMKRALGLLSYYSNWVQRFSDKVKPIIQETEFPLSPTAVASFNGIKRDIASASLSCPNSSDLLVVETDASDIALSAVLHQNRRPIAFFSRTLQPHERKHPSIEKEAAAIVEACRRWRHYLCSQKFKLLTDQQAVSFIFDNGRHGKTKNDKIERWRIEMSCFEFDIQFRPGKLNVTADCLSRAICSAVSNSETTLQSLHEGLCHPGITRMYHYVRTRNLPYSMQEVKAMTSRCRTCAEKKPRFLRPNNPPLIKATQPFERLSIDFKGPLPTTSQNRYLLTIIDEYSRFVFAYPCKDMTASTAILRLGELFSVFGLTGYIHSDNGPAFISKEYTDWLLSLGVAYSNSAVYNPKGNGQVERYNGIVWKGVELALHSKNMEIKYWETVLPSVLHSIRTLVCTATNMTPHERLFSFARRTMTGHSLPSWVTTNGKALVKTHVRSSKYDPWVEECEILHATPTYAQIRTAKGKEQTVSLRDLAPLPVKDPVESDSSPPPPQTITPMNSPEPAAPIRDINLDPTNPQPMREHSSPSISIPTQPVTPPSAPAAEVAPRRSTRQSAPVDRLNYEVLGGS